MIYFDYLDQSMSMHSPDTADPSVTQRVITMTATRQFQSGELLIRLIGYLLLQHVHGRVILAIVSNGQN
jgi:hypothetical protein